LDESSGIYGQRQFSEKRSTRLQCKVWQAWSSSRISDHELLFQLPQRDAISSTRNAPMKEVEPLDHGLRVSRVHSEPDFYI
jgi:hypothetical protein